MAELVDALDSKSSSFGSAGSIPAPGTFLLLMRSHFLKSFLLAVSTLFAVHVTYHFVQFVVLWLLDFRPVEWHFETTWFQTSLDPRAWSKKRILAVYGSSTIAMFSIGILAKIFTPTRNVETQDSRRLTEIIYTWIFVWTMVYGLADIFAAPFIKSQIHVANLQSVYQWYFQGQPIESIGFVFALIAMPFALFVPLLSLRQFLSTTEFPQDLVFWTGRFSLLMSAVVLPGILAHTLVIVLLFSLPKYTFDALIAYEMFRLITSFAMFASFLLLSGVSRSVAKNTGYSFVNISSVIVVVITLATVYSILVLGIRIA